MQPRQRSEGTSAQGVQADRDAEEGGPPDHRSPVVDTPSHGNGPLTVTAGRP
jgi:hypothetical protein